MTCLCHALLTAFKKRHLEPALLHAGQAPCGNKQRRQVWERGKEAFLPAVHGSTSMKLALVCFRGEVPKLHWTHTTNRERWERTTGICHVARPTSPHSPIWREAVNGEGFPPPPFLGACGKYVGLITNLVVIESGASLDLNCSVISCSLFFWAPQSDTNSL